MRTAALLALLALAAYPQEAAQKAIAATRGTVRRTLPREGTLIPAGAADLKLDLKAYRGEQTFRILEVAGHGAFVNAGDVVLRLDTEAIDDLIKREEMALQRSEMDLRHSEERARAQEEQAQTALARSEVDHERAQKRLKGYREIEKPYTEENERLNAQAALHRLEDAKDELVQLEKMYSEDELVDATEEIVLKRQRRGFARSQAGYDQGERWRVYQKEWYDTWREEDLVYEGKQKEQALAGLRSGQAMAREKTEADLAQKRYDIGQQKERLDELKGDRGQFLVRAPRAGTVIHGAPDGAPWSARLEKDGSVRNRAVFATVAVPRQLKVLTEIAEKDLLSVKPGAAAEVIPTIGKEHGMVGRLGVDPMPAKAGSFRAEVELGEAPVALRPGMTCKLEIILEEAKDAVLVPKAAVREGHVEAAKTAEGPYERRAVTVGISDDTHTVILTGLEAGEFVMVPAK